MEIRCQATTYSGGVIVQCDFEEGHKDAHVNEETETAWANE
jgi:hypothetical protein